MVQLGRMDSIQVKKQVKLSKRRPTLFLIEYGQMRTARLEGLEENGIFINAMCGGGKKWGVGRGRVWRRDVIFLAKPVDP